MRLRDVKGKRIVGVIRGRMSSNNRMTSHDVALVLEDSRGARSYLRWSVIEETDGACYGVELVYPGTVPK